MAGGTFYRKKLRLSIINASRMTVKPKMYTVLGIPFGLFLFFFFFFCFFFFFFFCSMSVSVNEEWKAARLMI